MFVLFINVDVISQVHTKRKLNLERWYKNKQIDASDDIDDIQSNEDSLKTQEHFIPHGAGVTRWCSIKV